MKMRRLFLSKWLYYCIIAVALLLLLVGFLQLALEGNNIAANFVSEIWGLLFTLAIFIVILDFRELLEWKSVEDRVKQRIGRKINEIFSHFSLLCIVKSPRAENTMQETFEIQLNALASEEVKLNAVYKGWLLEEDARLYQASFAEASRAYLAEIEYRYSKFLDSEVQASLMDIQDYLEKISREFRLMPKQLPTEMKELMPKRKEMFYRSVSDLLGKIMKEIAKIRGKKIDIGF